MFVMNHIRWM